MGIMLCACSRTSVDRPSTHPEQSVRPIVTEAPIGAFISQQTAIEIATKQASIGDGHISGAAEPLKNIQATLIPITTAQAQLESSGWVGNLPETADVMVWVITMDGAWTLEGGPAPPLTPQPTISSPRFTHYLVILNAQTGKVLFTTAR